MAEQVNQRIEDMINELEQMRRTNLYDDEEIKEISRKRKDFEYKVQRRTKNKEDFAKYIAYELALLEDISLRRKKNELGEKRKDIEYAIAKRLNRLFKYFIYRFQDDVEIYFEYIKFCKGVGFNHAISGIIGQMLQIHGDKPKMWQMASRWERLDQNNLEAAREFLLKGIHRHPEADILYIDLFEIELILAFKTEDEEEQEKLLKRAEVVWKNGSKTLNDVKYLFKICDLSMKFEVDEFITKEVKKEIWSNRDQKEVWAYIAAKELEGCHWEEIEQYLEDEEHSFPRVLANYIAIYEEALQQFPDKNLCTRYLHGLLGLREPLCTDLQKIRAVKQAWMYGHENGLLTDDMYEFGIELFKLEGEKTEQELMEILDAAAKVNPRAGFIWKEKLKLSKSDEQKISILRQASKVVGPKDALILWNLMLDSITSKVHLQNLYKRFQTCESSVLLEIKPKLLQKMYEHNGLKAAREIYEEMIRAPPTQIELHRNMIEIEKSQEKINLKEIRKCYECAVQHHGMDNVDIWMEYSQFETESGNAQSAPAIYRRAIGMLKKELVDEFIKAQTLAKLKVL